MSVWRLPYSDTAHACRPTKLRADLLHQAVIPRSSFLPLQQSPRTSFTTDVYLKPKFLIAFHVTSWYYSRYNSSELPRDGRRYELPCLVEPLGAFVTVSDSPYSINMESSNNFSLWEMCDLDMGMPQAHEPLSPSAVDPVAFTTVCYFLSFILLPLVDGHFRSHLHWENPQ
jgi:hypothetical protein